VYVVERSAMLHGIVCRHLQHRLPDVLPRAGAYLAGNERAIGARLRELGELLDTVARTDDIADQIVNAAHAAFRCQQRWFGEPATRLRVA
jgi:heme oxygenase